VTAANEANGCGIDPLNLGNGRYRYCVDLINGLARIDSGFPFLIVGSLLRPELAEP
jgi:hypothetical protein